MEDDDAGKTLFIVDLLKTKLKPKRKTKTNAKLLTIANDENEEKTHTPDRCVCEARFELCYSKPFHSYKRIQ